MAKRGVVRCEGVRRAREAGRGQESTGSAQQTRLELRRREERHQHSTITAGCSCEDDHDLPALSSDLRTACHGVPS